MSPLFQTSCVPSTAAPIITLSSPNSLGMNPRLAHALLELEVAEAFLARSRAQRQPQPSYPWLLNSLLAAWPSTLAHTAALPLVDLKRRISEFESSIEEGFADAVASDDDTSSSSSLSALGHHHPKQYPASPSSIESILLAAASSTNPAPEYLSKAGALDILCGRGGKSNHHIGNKRYRKVVSEVKSQYQQLGSKSSKTDMSRAIVDHVYEYGGRFLKYEKNERAYLVLPASEARKKTSQALREVKAVKWTNK